MNELILRWVQEKEGSLGHGEVTKGWITGANKELHIPEEKLQEIHSLTMTGKRLQILKEKPVKPRQRSLSFTAIRLTINLGKPESGITPSTLAELAGVGRWEVAWRGKRFDLLLLRWENNLPLNESISGNLWLRSFIQSTGQLELLA